MATGPDLRKLLPLRFRWRGEIAAAVYGELGKDELNALEDFLARNPRARAEFEALKAAHIRMPIDIPHLGIDLTPILRSRLAEESMRAPKARGAQWRVAVFATASAMVVGVFSFLAWQGAQPVAMPGALAQSNRTPAIQLSMDVSVGEADRLIADRNFEGAYRTLEKAIEEHPTDPKAGPAQLKLAGIAFNELQKYKEARDAYKRLLNDYRSFWVTLPLEQQVPIRQIYDMLDEASNVQYASLRDLDLARRAGSDSSTKLTGVIANYPGTFVASAAANEMASAVLGEHSDAAGGSIVHAMETVRGHSDNAVVTAQLDFELGCLYRDKSADKVRAREHFEKARTTNQPLLAKRAQDALDALTR